MYLNGFKQIVVYIASMCLIQMHNILYEQKPVIFIFLIYIEYLRI